MATTTPILMVNQGNSLVIWNAVILLLMEKPNVDCAGLTIQHILLLSRLEETSEIKHNYAPEKF